MSLISPAALRAQLLTDTAHRHLTTLLSADAKVSAEFKECFALTAARTATASAEPSKNVVTFARTLVSPVDLERGIATALLYVAPSESGITKSSRAIAETMLGTMKGLGVVFENEPQFIKKCAGVVEHSINCSTVRLGDFYGKLRLPNNFSSLEFQLALQAEYKTPAELSKTLAGLIQGTFGSYDCPISRGLQEGISYSVLPQNLPVAHHAIRFAGKSSLLPSGLPNFIEHTARIVFEGPVPTPPYSREGDTFSHLPENWLQVVQLCCVGLPQFYATPSARGRTAPQDRDLLERVPQLMEQLTTPQPQRMHEVMSDTQKLVRLISLRSEILQEVGAKFPPWMTAPQLAAMRQVISDDIAFAGRVVEMLTPFASKAATELPGN